MTSSVLPSVVMLVMVAAHVFLLTMPCGVAATYFFQEYPCSRVGGICTHKSTCPLGNLHNVMGLCPRQQAQGVECCNGIPTDIRICRDRGGECFPKEQCRGPKDPLGVCQEGYVCCILV